MTTGNPDFPVRSIAKKNIVSINGEPYVDQEVQVSTGSQFTVLGNNGKSYTVTASGKSFTCTCTGFSFRRTCSHVNIARAQKDLGFAC